MKKKSVQIKVFRVSIEWILLSTFFIFNYYLLFGHSIGNASFFAIMEDIYDWKFFLTIYPLLIGLTGIYFSIYLNYIQNKIQVLFFFTILIASLPLSLFVISLIFQIDFYHTRLPELFFLGVIIYRVRNPIKMLLRIKKDSIKNKDKLWVNFLFVFFISSLLTVGVIKTVEIFSNYKYIVSDKIIEKVRINGNKTKDVQAKIGDPLFKFIYFKNQNKETIQILLKKGRVIRIYSNQNFIRIGQDEKEIKNKTNNSLHEIWVYSYIPYGSGYYSNTIEFNDDKCYVPALVEMW